MHAFSAAHYEGYVWPLQGQGWQWTERCGDVASWGERLTRISVETADVKRVVVVVVVVVVVYIYAWYTFAYMYMHAEFVLMAHPTFYLAKALHLMPHSKLIAVAEYKYNIYPNNSKLKQYTNALLFYSTESYDS